jgi:rhodanese-related sulfurtransferase
MQLNFPKIAFIILLSSLLGLAVNYFSANGLPLIYKSTEIGWADDSLINLHLQEKPAEDNISSSEEDINDLPAVKDEQSQSGSNNTEIKENKIIDEKSAAIPAPPVKVDVDMAFKLYNAGVLFLDARPIEEFNEGHIKGAVTLPYYSEDHETTLSRISKNDPVVVYCSGTDCDLSVMMGNKLHKMGYEKVFVFFGGWDEWLNKNYPVELLEADL